MSKWMDIKTAPSNKSVLVAYKNRLDKWRIVIGTYYTEGTLPNDWELCEDDSEFAPAGWYEECEAADYIYPLAGIPTLWMHLLEPPTEPREQS